MHPIEAQVRSHLAAAGLSPEATDLWLRSPSAALDGRTPREAIADGQGAEVLASADELVFALA